MCPEGISAVSFDGDLERGEGSYTMRCQHGMYQLAQRLEMSSTAELVTVTNHLGSLVGLDDIVFAGDILHADDMWRLGFDTSACASASGVQCTLASELSYASALSCNAQQQEVFSSWHGVSSMAANTRR